jgi:hypothetical protein
LLTYTPPATSGTRGTVLGSLTIGIVADFHKQTSLR